MTWRHSAEFLNTQEPAGWSTERYRSSREALAAGRAAYGGDQVVWTAWVIEQPYAAQLPPVEQLLSEAKERAAERGADVSSFDSLEDADKQVLAGMLSKTIANWEAWLTSGPNGAGKRSSVVIVENQERHEP